MGYIEEDEFKQLTVSMSVITYCYANVQSFTFHVAAWRSAT